MIRIGIVLMLAGAAAAPAWACGQNAGSTFCADGWVAQPVEGRHTADGADTGNSDQADPAVIGDQGVYVEGAVVLDDPAAADDGQL